MLDNHNGPAHFVGELPIDMNAPPVIGEVARLTARGFEFDVEITRIEGENLSGRVIRIGSDPATEELGVNRDDVTEFRLSQIQTLYRDRTQLFAQPDAHPLRGFVPVSSSVRLFGGSMSNDQLTIEALRRWSQILFWVSIVLPVLGAVAAGARYYVERAEKAASSRIIDQSLSSARAEAQAARSELSAYETRNAPRRLTQQQRNAVAQAVAGVASLPVIVASRMMDGESLDYATDIAEALRASVPSVPAVVQTSLNDFPGFVAVHSPPQYVPNQQGQLLAGLAAGAVPVRQQQIAVGSIGAYNSSAYYVVVGRKGP